MVWKRGLIFRVVIHLNYIEDYTVAPMLDAALGSLAVPFKPIVRGMPWKLGMVDVTPIEGSTERILREVIP